MHKSDVYFTNDDFVEAYTELQLKKYPKAKFSVYFLYRWLEIKYYGVFEPHHIMQSVNDVENSTNSSHTKRHRAFTSGPLKGVYKKHFTSPRHIRKNIGVETGLDSKDEIKIDKRIRAVIRDYPEQSRFDAVAHKFSVEAYDQRMKSNSLTGDYVIFAQLAHTNYYLSIEPHDMSSDSVFQRISEVCLYEFPELRTHKAFKNVPVQENA
ncbi:hypothetical protein [Aurantivibrio plasticivorans]